MTHPARLRTLLVSPHLIPAAVMIPAVMAGSLLLPRPTLLAQATPPSQQPAPQAAPAVPESGPAAQPPATQQPSAPAPTTPAPTPSTPVASTPAATGGTIHGTVKDSNIPLPGVTVTASNSLTGKKYSTTTDITGGYTLVIPQNGRYVIRADFAAFAPATKEAVLNATAHDQAIDFSIMLASRAVEQEQQQSLASAARQYLGSGAQNLSLLGAASDLIQAGAGGEQSGAELPSLAGNSDMSSGESVAVTGQTGTTNPFAGVDFGQMRDNAQLNQSLSGGGPGGQGGQGGGPGGGGGGFGGGGGGFGGGGGGFGGGRGGGGGGFRGNFRNFKPNQPHGAIFWNGGNGALNAEDFALRGQSFQEPSYDSNRFGATLMTPPYIPKLLTNDRNDMLFFTLSGTHSLNPVDEYGTVPTLAERSGDFAALTTPGGTPITIYNPAASTCTAGGNTPGTPFVGNVIPAQCLTFQGKNLLTYVPLPNLTSQTENYQRLASAGTHTTQLGVRFMHSFGSSSGANNGLMRMARQYLGQGNPTLTQSMNANFNYSHSASDHLNLFPELGGKSQSHQYSLQLGYSIGKGRLTDTLTGSWNNSHSQATNYFSNVTDIAPELGLSGLPQSPQLWGLPNVTLNQFSGLSESQPSFVRQETVGLADQLAWVHGKHNVRFGGDIRRVFYDMIGNTDSTGTFVFTGLFTQAPGTSGTTGAGATTGINGFATSGSSLADLLLGLPQETTLQAAYQETHLRENEMDGYAQDDWRAMKNLTLLFGLRYDYDSPYSEEHDRLATLDLSSDYLTAVTVTPNGVAPYSGKYPRDLVYPEKNNFSPRIGFAVHPWTDTTIRGGFGINYTVGQYVKFVQDFAFEPPFADVQTNDLVSTAPADLASVVTCSAYCLANGFPSPQAEGNYAVNKNYRLPYVQVWNLNVQRTIPGNVVLNFGYNGSKGTRLDVISAPGRYPQPGGSFLTPNVLYDYEQSVAFSNYNAFTFSARRRLSAGLSLQATYTYGHSIDDASSVGGNGGTTSGGIVQNWQDILAEESNSSFDVRHQVTGSWVYELPFGPNRHMLTAGWLGHTLADMNLSGTYAITSGNPLTPSYEASVEDVSRGTTGSLRPDRVPGVPLATGGGKLDNWFNKDAFAAPTGVYGNASRFSIPGPGTITVDMSASKSFRFGDTKNLELRATANNVFNTVQYSGVDTTLGTATYGDVTSTAAMRQFTFMGRYRF